MQEIEFERDTEPFINAGSEASELHDQAVVPAIQRIAPEVLCEIFWWACSTGEYGAPCTRVVAGHFVRIAPWKLSHVSQHWRATAHGDASLWSNVEINAEPYYLRPIDSDGNRDSSQPAVLTQDSPQVEYPLAALEMQLSLSANAPLCVIVRLKDRPNGPAHAHVISLLETLVLHSDHWKVLILVFETDLAVVKTLSHMKRRLSCLTHFHLCCKLDERWPTELRDIFLDSPQLQRLYIVGQHGPPILLPYQQLSHLDLPSCSMFLIHGLTAAENLRDLSLGMSNDDDSNPAALVEGIITLPNLRSLLIYDGRFSQIIEAPKLEYLFIWSRISTALPLLRRFCGQLEKLEIRCYRTETSVLPSVLRLVPNLLELGVMFDERNSVKTDETDGIEIPKSQIFRAMELSGSAEDICPQLTSARFTLTPDTVSEDWDSLYSMLNSRWDPGHRLKRALLEPAVPLALSISTKFEALKADGLELEIGEPFN
ncbi:hypothetical protein R3P38DRAFT_1636894 [Favolaschia claudopus]|uniref:F-box domain-containing protein n=1 Tax=Favolaschia claudopus TaxID=2862362 RepID=A0AAW0DM16_9AGAR